MNKITAQRVKEDILDKISDQIPSQLVNPLWEAYLEEFNPANRHAPCTCSPREWVGILNKVRERVNEALMAQTIVVEQQQIVEKQDPLVKLQEEAKQRHSKKK
jgi:hypothetical protein